MNNTIDTTVTLKCICCDSSKSFAPEFAPFKYNGEGNYLCGECTRIKKMGMRKIQEEAIKCVHIADLAEYAKKLDAVFRMFYLKSSK